MWQEMWSTVKSWFSSVLSSLKKACKAIVKNLLSVDSVLEIVSTAINTVRAQGLTGDEAFDAVKKLLLQWAAEGASDALKTLLESDTDTDTTIQILYAGMKKLGTLVEVGSAQSTTTEA